MIRVFALEFVNICRYLEKSGCRKKAGAFYVEQEQLRQYLDKNKYAPVKRKLEVWKALKWLITDSGHMTKRVYIGAKKYQRIYVIDMTVYQVMQHLIDNEGTGNVGGHI